MGPVAPAGVANPGTQKFSQKQENWGSAASVMLLRKALCVKGLAVRQIAWYQRSAERSSQTSLSGSYTPGANLLIVCGEKSQGALSSLVQAHQSPEYLARLPNI